MSKDIKALEARLGQLEGICQLWMAANDAKDARIAELEQENQRLSQRVARLARLAQGGTGSRVRRKASNG